MTADNWTAIAVAALGLLGTTVTAVVGGVVLWKVRRLEPVVHAINATVNSVPEGQGTLRQRTEDTGTAVDELVRQERDRVTERDDA